MATANRTGPRRSSSRTSAAAKPRCRFAVASGGGNCDNGKRLMTGPAMRNNGPAFNGLSDDRPSHESQGPFRPAGRLQCVVIPRAIALLVVEPVQKVLRLGETLFAPA